MIRIDPVAVITGIVTGIIIALNNPYAFLKDETFHPAFILFASMLAGTMVAFRKKLMRTRELAAIWSFGIGILLGITVTGMEYSSIGFTLMAMALFFIPVYWRQLFAN